MVNLENRKTGILPDPGIAHYEQNNVLALEHPCLQSFQEFVSYLKDNR